jgi:hypothetical protein
VSREANITQTGIKRNLKMNLCIISELVSCGAIPFKFTCGGEHHYFRLPSNTYKANSIAKNGGK